MMYLAIICIAVVSLANLKPAHCGNQFELPNYFKGSVYLISQKVQKFNVDKAYDTCVQAGGYLVEFNTEDEYKFVRDLVKKAGGTEHFFTGANDIVKEGKFVFTGSGDPFTLTSLWARGQPDNYGGKEDCQEIRTNFEGGKLNDEPCTTGGKYVCEVPIWW